MYKKNYHIHFIGIAGIGMSGIANILIKMGYKVSGSDIVSSDITEKLSELGASIFKGHDKRNIRDANLLVISSAIKDDNPEIIEAKKRGVLIIKRAEILAELMRIKYSIAVSGAHGKTTTTSIIAAILQEGGLAPSVIIGGKLKKAGTNAVIGNGEYIVAEADESDGSLSIFSPAIAVVTNIDREHLDYYKNGIEDIKDTFLNFIKKIPFYGLAVLCTDNEHISSILPKIEKRKATYGILKDADFIAKDIVFGNKETFFSVYKSGKKIGDIKLGLLGLHNVYNALAGIAVGMELDISFENIKNALAKTEGVQRRMDIKGDVNNALIIDDYGHHPTEIKATLDTIRKAYKGKNIITVFQPHRYSRTKALFNDFIKSFDDTDMLVLLPIYAASEKNMEDITSYKLYESIKKSGHKNVIYMSSIDDAVLYLKNILKKDDLLLTLGAGDVYKVGDMLLSDERRI